MAQYLQTKVKTDHSYTIKFVTVVRRITECLLRSDDPQGGQHQVQQLRLDYTLDLCTAAIEYLGNWTIFERRHNHSWPEASREQGVQDAGVTDVDLLTAAARTGSTLLAKDLLKKDVDVNGTSSWFGKALHQAALQGHNDIILLLIEHGAELDESRLYDSRNEFPWQTTLQAACFGGHEATVKLLLVPKYPIPTSGETYIRAVHNAARGGHPKVLRFLLRSGTAQDSTQLEHLRCYILSLACIYGSKEVATMMLDAGVNVNPPNGPAYTPLSAAIRQGHYHIVCLLLERGAQVKGFRPNLKNWRYRNGCEFPMQKAARLGYERIAQVLFDFGAEIDEGLPTPIEIAASYGHPHMVRFFLEKGAKSDTVLHS